MSWTSKCLGAACGAAAASLTNHATHNPYTSAMVGAAADKGSEAYLERAEQSFQSFWKNHYHSGSQGSEVELSEEESGTISNERSSSLPSTPISDSGDTTIDNDKAIDSQKSHQDTTTEKNSTNREETSQNIHKEEHRNETSANATDDASDEDEDFDSM